MPAVFMLIRGKITFNSVCNSIENAFYCIFLYVLG